MQKFIKSKIKLNLGHKLGFYLLVTFETSKTCKYSIYKNDGQSLNNWLNQSNNESYGDYEAKDVSIATYRGQFRNMLSLDIWIDKLLEWQRNNYRLDMPAKEQVDPLSWNKVLRSKLNQAMNEDNEAMMYQQNNPIAVTEPSRKRTYQELASNTTMPIKDSDKYRQVKMKKIHEFDRDSRNESVISTEKTSEVSHIIRKQNQQKQMANKKVSMGDLLK